MYLPTLSIENGKATIYVIDTYDGEIVFEVREPREEITWELFMSLLLTYIEQAEEFLERGWDDAMDTFSNDEEE